jgi:hypothetical protein
VYEAPEDSCVYDDAKREFQFPETTTDGDGFDFGGVVVSRKLYVAAQGVPFARWLTILRNPDLDGVTVSFSHIFDFGHTDGEYRKASGSGLLAAGDRWITHRSAPASGDTVDQPGATIFDGPGGADAFDRHAHAGDPAAGMVAYDDVVLAGGETAVFMFVEAQRDTIEDADAFVAQYDGHPDLFAGMTDEELANLRNWRAPQVAPPPPPRQEDPRPADPQPTGTSTPAPAPATAGATSSVTTQPLRRSANTAKRKAKPKRKAKRRAKNCRPTRAKNGRKQQRAQRRSSCRRKRARRKARRSTRRAVTP